MLSELIKRLKAKSDLNKCFMNAGLYKTYKNSSGRTFYSYPKIHAAVFRDDSIQYIFTLLNGMDPKEVMKKEYVFKQSFGSNVELEGDYKRFTLTIYQKTMPKELIYSQEEVIRNISRVKY